MIDIASPQRHIVWRPLCCVSLIVILAFVSCSTLVQAQGQLLGAIHGTVKDPQGYVLRGVMVTAIPADGRRPLTARTDAVGLYRLNDLHPGEYEIRFELAGFGTLVQAGVRAQAGLTLSLDLVMAVGGIDDVVTVRREKPLLESKTATQAFNVTGDFQRSVPSSGRRYWHDFLTVMPGTVNTELGAQPYIVHGASSNSLVIQLDGADIASALQSTNAYINLSNDALEDVQVKVGGVDASAPLGNGPVINMVTKSGTNDLRATATAVYLPNRWNDNNNPGGTVTALESIQPDLSLGGPIIRDRIWFFGAYRYRFENSGISRSEDQVATLTALVPAFQPFDNTLRAHYPFIKVSAQLAPVHHAHILYQRDGFPQSFNGSLDGSPFSTRRTGGIAVSGRVTSAWGRAWTTQLNLSINDKTVFSESNGVGPNTPVHRAVFLSGGRLHGTGAVATLHNVALAADTRTSKWTAAADATFFHQGVTGSHELRFGVFSQPRQRITSTTRYSNDGFALEEVVLVDPLHPASGTLPFHRRIYDVSSIKSLDLLNSDSAVYIQDAWNVVPRLTINAGIRIDFVRRRDDLFGIATQTSTEIGPRLGVNYLITPSGRDAVRLSWSRVHDVVSRALITTGTTVAGLRDIYDTNFDGVFDTVFVTPGASARTSNRTIDSRFHQPFTDEWSIGYRRQVGGGTTLESSFIHRAFKDRPTDIEINGIYDDGVFRGYRDPMFNEVFFVTNNTYNTPIYDAVEVVASSQTKSAQLVASYTRQWRRLSGSWQPNDPASLIQPLAFPNNKGIGSEPGSSETNGLSGTAMTGGTSARDHLVRLSGVYHAPWKLAVATHYTYQSPLWVGPTIDRITTSDARFGPTTVTLVNGRVVSNPLATLLRFVGPTRGDDQTRLPATHVWNLRVSREIAIGKSRLTPALEVFNIPNFGSEQFIITGQTNQRFSPNFEMGTQRQLPRAASLAIRWVF